MEELVLPREEHTNWLFSDKQSAQKTYLQVTLYGINRLYLGIYTHTHMHAITISGEKKKEAIDLKESQGQGAI